MFSSVIRRNSLIWLVWGALLVSCHRNRNDALGNLDPKIVKQIELGLEKQFNTLQIPIGSLEILSPEAVALHSPDASKMQFGSDYRNYLKWLESKKLVKLTVRQNLSLSAANNSLTVVVEPAEIAVKAANHRLSSDHWLVIKVSMCNVTKVTAAYDCQTGKGKDARDYRLVEGLYRAIPGDALKTMDPSALEFDFKFRVALLHDPQTDGYTFVTADWGMPESGWATSNIKMPRLPAEPKL